MARLSPAVTAAIKAASEAADSVDSGPAVFRESASRGAEMAIVDMTIPPSWLTVPGIDPMRLLENSDDLPKGLSVGAGSNKAIGAHFHDWRPASYPLSAEDVPTVAQKSHISSRTTLANSVRAFSVKFRTDRYPAFPRASWFRTVTPPWSGQTRCTR